MADNTVLNMATTVGDTIRNVAKAGGVKTHACVLDVGGAGAERLVGDAGVTLPVSGTVAVGNFPATHAITAAALPLPAGAATEATLAAVVSQAGFDSRIGALSETAPATDTAAAGLNGRLQRVAQRLSTLLAAIPASLTGAGNFKVAVAEQTAAVPAGTNLIGQVAAGQQLGVVYSGATPLVVQSVAINASAAGWSTLVAGQAGKKVTVLGFTLVCGNAVAVKLADFDGATTYVDLTGSLAFAANSGAGASVSPLGQFTTQTGHGLALNLATAAPVGGYLVYTQG